MKKLAVLLFSLTLATSALGYKVKPEAGDLGRYTIANYETKFKELKNVPFNSFGEPMEAPNRGYYTFVPLLENGKVVAYGGLTHVKAYNKHEALLTVISPDGKLLDFSLPEVNDKHKGLRESDWKKDYIGRYMDNIPMDGYAGSTFHMNSLNGELKNTLRAFKMMKDDEAKAGK